MIRFIAVILFIVIFLIVSIPIQLVLLIIKKFNPYAVKTASLKIVGFAFNVVMLLSGTKVTVIGEENVPKDRSVLYVGNHRSYFDIVVTYPRVPRPTGYISKDVIKKIPVLGYWMIFLDCLFLDRSDNRRHYYSLCDRRRTLRTLSTFPGVHHQCSPPQKSKRKLSLSS